jgi:hypothetical protein
MPLYGLPPATSRTLSYRRQSTLFGSWLKAFWRVDADRDHAVNRWPDIPTQQRQLSGDSEVASSGGKWAEAAKHQVHRVD